jgi:4a-hydroxytetrahydrobiopterin dehydratase
MKDKQLDGLELRQALVQLQGWHLDSTPPCIVKSWHFDTFRAAVRFFDQVAELAELHDHHPECLSVYTRMQIRLWTHDAGGLTAKDIALALAIEHSMANRPPSDGAKACRHWPGQW